MILTEQMLANAAAEVDEAMLRGLPEPEECRPEFSRWFEQKMKRVLRRGRHPALYRVMQRAAAFVQVLFLGFAAIMAVSPTVRASVFGWIRETCNSFYKYYYEDVSTAKTEPVEVEAARYVLTGLSEEYTKVMDFEDNGNRIVSWTDGDGQVLHFSYGPGDEGSFYVEKDGYDVSTVTFAGKEADLYLARDAAHSNGIIWFESYSKMAFFISGYLDQEELIALAQSVRRADGYVLTGMPDGYSAFSVREGSDFFVSVFINEEETLAITFNYGYTESGAFFLCTDGQDIVPVMVDEKEADMYLAQEAGKNNSVIWSDEETRLIFYLSAPMDADALIDLAESVEPVG